MDKILVTDAAGLLGTNIALSLLENDNYIVYGVDSLQNSDVSSLYMLLKNERFNFIQGDINKLNLPYVDKIIHPVINDNLNDYNLNKYEYIFKRTETLNKILDCSKKYSAKTIFLSKFINKNKHTNNMDLYFDFINLAQNLIKSHKDIYKTDSLTLRLSNTYGFSYSKQNFNIIENIIYNALLNKDFEIDYDRQDYWVFIDDVSRIVNTMLKADVNQDVIDVSDSTQYSLSEFVNYILEYTNSSSKITYKDNNKISASYTPDLNILNNTLNYECNNDYKQNVASIINKVKIGYFS